MTLAAGAGVAAIGTAGRGLFLPWFDISRAAAAEELVEPEVRASRDGLLDTTLTASVMPLPLAGQTATVSVYEGSFPGPTLRVRPGDTLRVNLVNTLDAVPSGLPQTQPVHLLPGHRPRSHANRRARNDVRHESPRARVARLPRGQLGQHLSHRQGWRELPVRVPDPGRPSRPVSTGTTRTCTAR